MKLPRRRFLHLAVGAASVGLLAIPEGATAQSSGLVGTSQPKPDCKAYAAYDRYHEMPGYLIANPNGTTVCVPFLATAPRPPTDYQGKDFYVEEFTDAKLKGRWETCKADVFTTAQAEIAHGFP
jgi:hypothetical protein